MIKLTVLKGLHSLAVAQSKQTLTRDSPRQRRYSAGKTFLKRKSGHCRRRPKNTLEREKYSNSFPEAPNFKKIQGKM